MPTRGKKKKAMLDTNRCVLMVKNQIRPQRNAEEKVSLITCMCPVGWLAGFCSGHTGSASPLVPLQGYFLGMSRMFCVSFRTPRSPFTLGLKRIAHIYSSWQVSMVTSWWIFFSLCSFLNHFLTLGTLFTQLSLSPPNITTLNSSFTSRDFFSSSLKHPPTHTSWSVPPVMTPPQSALFQWNPDRHTTLSLSQKKTTPGCS